MTHSVIDIRVQTHLEFVQMPFGAFGNDLGVVLSRLGCLGLTHSYKTADM